ncbi:lasso peptide biosynthesis B2 protein [Escherichia coli]|uniref:lasso peptide biosynthesis B2 protein n=1 Tax=Escherichia coli TaxID=562 RepID=UPI000E0F22AB|nr:lasso peptide biosynthesis B2 protein [Escherichia coli]
MTDFGGKTSIFSHPVYLFLRKFSLQDSRGGSDAHLVIGVRTQPFYSHSWVEVGGQVINDAPNMRDKLSVIAEI